MCVAHRPLDSSEFIEIADGQRALFPRVHNAYINLSRSLSIDFEGFDLHVELINDTDAEYHLAHTHCDQGRVHLRTQSNFFPKHLVLATRGAKDILSLLIL